jgi:thiol-disulfide isomerase/thioredoxin
LFQKKIDDYFTKLVIPLPDSLCQEIDRLLENVAGTKEVFKYLLWNFIVKYERSEIMGMDAVFVHLVKKYIILQPPEWLNEIVRQNLIDWAKTLDPLLIGKPAPVMILLDTNDTPVSLYSINAKYTIIYFWEKDCGHCQKETPLLKSFYDDSHDSLNFEVYAVCIDTSIVAWKKYIREKDFRWVNVNGYLSMTRDFHDLYDVHSSPVMYLLDEKKNILAKRILTEQIKGLILKKENTKPGQ